LLELPQRSQGERRRRWRELRRPARVLHGDVLAVRPGGPGALPAPRRQAGLLQQLLRDEAALAPLLDRSRPDRPFARSRTPRAPSRGPGAFSVRDASLSPPCPG